MGRGVVILFLTLDIEISHPNCGRKNITPIKPLQAVQDFTLDKSLKDDCFKKKDRLHLLTSKNKTHNLPAFKNLRAARHVGSGTR